MNKGFLKLSRNYFNNPLWKEDRIFSRSEAWLDLIASALIDDLKVFVKGQDIEVQRGEVAASRRYLEKRWSWGSTKVKNYLTYLAKNGMITTKQTNGQTIIKLVKYEDYNSSQPTKQTTGKPPANQSKELKERKEIFKEQVFKYNGAYEFQMLCEFFDYWAEHKKTGKKMKFEFQRTWDLSLRLKKWKKNQDDWNAKKDIKVNKPQMLSDKMKNDYGI